MDKISRVEICKTSLKTRVDFAKVVMTDEKLFRLNWFSYHGKRKIKQKRLLRHSGGNGPILHKHLNQMLNGFFFEETRLCQFISFIKDIFSFDEIKRSTFLI